MNVSNALRAITAEDHPTGWPWPGVAACEGEDPRLFFPADGKLTPAAKEMCDACPVQAQCREFVTVTRIDFGTFGGLSEYDRRSKRRKSRRAQAVPEGEHPPE